MLEEFQKFIKNQQALTADDTCLLATSGGVDSVVLAHLFHISGQKFALAHVNYQLRGTESELDEQLVEALAKSYQVTCHSVRVFASAEAIKKNQSIQLFARNFRYAWFEQLRQKHSYKFIATAHHANDSLETAIFNLSRGTGISGLGGVPLWRGNIIRPLLFANKRVIRAYAEKNALAFREDASNDSLKYDRNMIRNEVIPLLRDINPMLDDTIARTFEQIRGSLALYREYIEAQGAKLLECKNNIISLRIDKLMESVAPTTLLYELLAPYGLNNTQAIQLIESIQQGIPGRTFSNPEWDILLDRDQVLIRASKQADSAVIRIEAVNFDYPLEEGTLEVRLQETVPAEIQGTKDRACLDLRKLQFPLFLRRWQQGDIFQPFGMQGQRKKVQDYLTNEKLNRFEKDQIWILESGGQIAWLVGYRIDERFKITPETTSVLELAYSLKKEIHEP
ncbi:MAG: tRNA lysidine(34) synthetase TilS [Saprospiraceae bacterium]|nr:tRNA lysidine(34) synthetase TilS [Saprospiraceae bacterium]